MGCCCRKPKKAKVEPEPNNHQEQSQGGKKTTFDFLQGISNKKQAKNLSNQRGKINIIELLPNNMFTHYDKLKLPIAPVDLSDFVKEAYIALNLLRADPVFFVNNFLETIRSRFQSDNTYKSFSNEIRNTTFGMFGVDNCIKYISNMEPCIPLYWSYALQAAAEGIVKISTGNDPNRPPESEETIELSGIVYEFTQRGSEVSFEVVTNLIFEDYEEMKMCERLCDAEIKFVGIAHFIDSIGDNITRIILSDSNIQDFKIVRKKKISQKTYYLHGYTENPKPIPTNSYISTLDAIQSPKLTKVVRFENDLRNVIPQINSRREFDFSERKETNHGLKYDTNNLFNKREQLFNQSYADSSNISIFDKTNDSYLQFKKDEETKNYEVEVDLKYDNEITSQVRSKIIMNSDIKPPSYFRIKI